MKFEIQQVQYKRLYQETQLKSESSKLLVLPAVNLGETLRRIPGAHEYFNISDELERHGDPENNGGEGEDGDDQADEENEEEEVPNEEDGDENNDETEEEDDDEDDEDENEEESYEDVARSVNEQQSNPANDPATSPPKELANGPPHLHGPYEPLLAHRLANAVEYGLFTAEDDDDGQTTLLMNDVLDQIVRLRPDLMEQPNDDNNETINPLDVREANIREEQKTLWEMVSKDADEVKVDEAPAAVERGSC
ncbi:GL21735 [Drosophila persimilis]|uniref:GL21735 n=1 Tax=Drosophila persimilis TaxID=7234 RepID=B4GEU2_DROPE|nr:GL21735 [Drosophila persimilis]